MNQSTKQQPSKGVVSAIIPYGVVIVVVVLSWAGLTKMGLLPNLLSIGFLCPYYKSSSIAPAPKIISIPNSGNLIQVEPGITVWKPVIYLYPQDVGPVEIKLNYSGNLTVTYPKYNSGWRVIAYPTGKIINLTDSKEYSYLFWEGKSNDKVEYDLSSGFVVEGKGVVNFLQEKLPELGLTPKEYNEFIVFWLPRMIDNEYNLIHFASRDEYEDRAVLSINPKPDSVLRVFMVFKKLDKLQKIEPQKTSLFERKGFTVVEWGGAEII